LGGREATKDGKSEQSEPWTGKRSWVMGEAKGNNKP